MCPGPNKIAGKMGLGHNGPPTQNPKMGPPAQKWVTQKSKMGPQQHGRQTNGFMGARVRSDRREHGFENLDDSGWGGELKSWLPSER